MRDGLGLAVCYCSSMKEKERRYWRAICSHECLTDGVGMISAASRSSHLV